MSLSKSNEFLNKINTLYASIDEPAEAIDIDILLGYIRIFYTSISEIKVKSSLSKQTSVQPDPSIDHSSELYIQSSTHWPEASSSQNQIDHLKVVKPIIEDHLPPIHIETSSESQQINQEHISAIAVNDEPEKIVTQENKFEDTLLPLTIVKPDTILDPTENLSQESLAKESSLNEIQNKLAQADHSMDIKEHAQNITKENNTDESTRVNAEVKLTEKPKNVLETLSPTYEAKEVFQHDSHSDSDAIEYLFRDKSPTGLIDFLGLSPLDDLNKAWGLNERLQVIKSLFNDDLNAFEHSISMINKLTTFEEAKLWLSDHIVRQYNWIDVSKTKKASEFILQVKRKFIPK